MGHDPVGIGEGHLRSCGPMWPVAKNRNEGEADATTGHLSVRALMVQMSHATSQPAARPYPPATTSSTVTPKAEGSASACLTPGSTL